jgi:L-fuconolactonase
VLIDAHQHFWRVGRNGFIWPTPDLTAIHRDFLPEDFDVVAGDCGVTGSVLVQSQPSDRDTDWLIDLAQATPVVRGVVGWVGLLTPHAPERIADLATRPKFRGVRPMLQTLADDDWIARPALEPALDALVDHDLSLDALVTPRHLKPLLTLAKRRPDLSIIIDHGAKPPVATQAFEGWARAIAEFAALPRVTCKLSGLLTEALPRQPADSVAPYIEHLVTQFGPDRLMWGSDWPVVNLASTYGDWLALSRRLCGLTDPVEISALFGGTARGVYRLDAGDANG